MASAEEIRIARAEIDRQKQIDIEVARQEYMRQLKEAQTAKEKSQAKINYSKTVNQIKQDAAKRASAIMMAAPSTQIVSTITGPAPSPVTPVTTPAPQPEQTITAYQNILTKEIFSAVKPPGELWQKVLVSMKTGKQVQPTPQEQFYEGYAPLPPPKQPTFNVMGAYTEPIDVQAAQRLKTEIEVERLRGYAEKAGLKQPLREAELGLKVVSSIYTKGKEKVEEYFSISEEQKLSQQERYRKIIQKKELGEKISVKEKLFKINYESMYGKDEEEATLYNIRLEKQSPIPLLTGIDIYGKPIKEVEAGEKFSLRTFPRYVATRITSIPALQPYVMKAEEKLKKVPLLEPTIRFLEPIAETVLFFNYFSPAISTAEYGEEEGVLGFAKKRQKGLSQLEYIDKKAQARAEATMSKYEKAAAKGNLRETLIKDLKEQAKKIAKETNPEKKATMIQQTKKGLDVVFENLRNKELIKGDLSAAQRINDISSQATKIINQFPDVIQLENIGSLLGISGLTQPKEQEMFKPAVSQEIYQPQRESISSFFGMPSATITRTEQKPKIKEIEKSVVGLLTPQIEIQVQPQPQRYKQELRTEQITTGLTGGGEYRYPEETGGIILPMFGRFKRKVVSEQGYDSYAYIQATKPKKSYWKKLNTQPMTKRSALSQSAEYVDETISARGKVSKSSSKKEPIDTGDDYFGVNRFKFRTFQQKKGTRTKLPNQFIERQAFRLDKAGETKQIKMSRDLIRGAFGF